MAPRVAEPQESSADREQRLATLFVNRFDQLIDVDTLLHEDDLLREEIITENAKLMAQARFPENEMIEWGRDNCWTPS